MNWTAARLSANIRFRRRLPIAHFPGHAKPAVAVRFNPIRFAYRVPSSSSPTIAAESPDVEGPTPVTPPDVDFSPRPMFQLPYRQVFAVATTDAVMIYDTQQQHPICAVSNMHLTAITDISWYALPGKFFLLDLTYMFPQVAR